MGDVTRERTLTKLELDPAYVFGNPGYVHAGWRRSDRSSGSAYVYFRPKAGERWYIAWVLVHEPNTTLMRDVPLARIETAVNADPEMREWIKQSTSEETLERMERAAAKRLRLKRPARRQLDDAFFERVAAAYRGAVANGLSPVKTLAADADTPPGTVSRWIATAREKGYLPEGEQGRVTT